MDNKRFALDGFLFTLFWGSITSIMIAGLMSCLTNRDFIPILLKVFSGMAVTAGLIWGFRYLKK